jgi:sulfur carrier protein
MVTLSNSTNLEQIVYLNGLPYQYKTPMTILQLLQYLGFNTKIIVVDYNGSVLQKENWKDTKLIARDSVEILTIAGGG